MKYVQLGGTGCHAAPSGPVFFHQRLAPTTFALWAQRRAACLWCPLKPGGAGGRWDDARREDRAFHVERCGCKGLRPVSVASRRHMTLDSTKGQSRHVWLARLESGFGAPGWRHVRGTRECHRGVPRGTSRTELDDVRVGPDRACPRQWLRRSSVFSCFRAGLLLWAAQSVSVKRRLVPTAGFHEAGFVVGLPAELPSTKRRFGVCEGAD